MERDVRMLQATGKKGVPKKKEPDQVLCGTPIYAARQRRVAAEARKEQIPELPLEVTQIAKVEEYLEYPPISWSMEYPLGLEKYQDTDEYLPIPPPGSSVGRPLEFDQWRISGNYRCRCCARHDGHHARLGLVEQQR